MYLAARSSVGRLKRFHYHETKYEIPSICSPDSDSSIFGRRNSILRYFRVIIAVWAGRGGARGSKCQSINFYRARKARRDSITSAFETCANLPRWIVNRRKYRNVERIASSRDNIEDVYRARTIVHDLVSSASRPSDLRRNRAHALRQYCRNVATCF